MDLITSAQYIKGVGPARFKLLNRLGVQTVEDLLYYFPRRYEDRRMFSPIARLKTGEYATVRGKIIRADLWRSPKKGICIFQIAVADESGVIKAVWFNQPFMKRYFKVGEEVILYGKVEQYAQRQMSVPEFEFISGKDSSLHIGRIVPIYPLTAKLNQRYLRTIISRAIKMGLFAITDMLTGGLRTKLNLLPLPLAIRSIHFPADFKAKDLAYRRLVFDEFFLFQTMLALKKLRQERHHQGIAHQAEGKLLERFLGSLPFKLTPEQDKVIKEIEEDMRSPKSMHRLLQGDVGSGKTIVAMYALLVSVQSGHQAALMAPTEILAQQHYLTLSNLLLALDINVGLLISGMSREARLNTLQDIQQGTLDIVVGTHALIEEAIQFKSLGLVVIDEQHKFGVVQRSLLRAKGGAADYLVMSATPIPRTLAMTVYGDMDISTIRELPQGRQSVSSILVKSGDVQEVYNFVREEITKGRQAYLVYPLVKKSGRGELKAATEMYARLKQEEFGRFSLGLIHGQMSATEKEQVMRSFKNRKIALLVSTTVIEVGIDIPNASVMVIEQAQRFGLSQIHQLRGRIGRGPYPSYCILVGEPQTEQAKRRIEAILSDDCGFSIAEQDLEIRGPGKFFGPAQHGLPELRIGSLVKDMALMELARKEAFALVQADPNLEASQYALLRRRLAQRFHSEKVGLVYA